MPRKSSAQKEAEARITASASRLQPPAGMARAETEEWQRIVNAYQPSHFPPGVSGLLEQYVRYTIASRDLGAMLEDLRKDKPKLTIEDKSALLTKLMTSLDRASQRIAAISVKLGLAFTTRTAATDDPQNPFTQHHSEEDDEPDEALWKD